jgi:cell division protease FtsH
LIDTEVNRIIQESYETARKLLSENRDKLEQLANALLDRETLEGEDLDKVFNQSPSDNSGAPAAQAIEQVKTEDKPKARARSKPSTSKLPGVVQPKRSPATG